MRTDRVTLVLLLGLVIGAAGCGSDKSAVPPAAEPGAISKADVPKGEWPLTVSKGVVRCEGGNGWGLVIFRAPDGTDYAVNGTAETAKPELPEIEAIWKKPNKYGLRINISPVIDKGLELCR